MNYHTRSILFPEGKTKALTLSYDDGVTQDKKLLDILDKYGIRCTFNLNSGCMGQVDYAVIKGVQVNHSHISAEEIKDVYKNHEVAIHTLTHPHLEQLPKEVVTYELIEDKKNLEELLGYPVRGMAYPFGTYDSDVIEVLKNLNIEYSRTVKSHRTFILPKDFLEWETTCHHSDKELLNLASEFIEKDEKNNVSLFYLWGHSYEFDIDNSWDTIETFGKIMGGNSKVWYATNIEIVNYINAFKSLKFSTTGSSVYNPSGIDVWMNINGKAFVVRKGCIQSIS